MVAWLGTLRAWGAPGPWSNVAGSRGCACLCVCMCEDVCATARARVRGAPGRNKLSRRRPSEAGAALRLAREGKGRDAAVAADSDISGGLLFRKFLAALAGG